ncbi:DNA adenine methylase [Salinibaculum rarum]|uniref:DNA adenine methylase n=1 Tax=Salinibaculum rarum TaxID=3058903 RepID=UPI00265EB782|nr:DNA adenine methylase [Salinibaculum sp. KK48]
MASKPSTEQDESQNPQNNPTVKVTQPSSGWIELDIDGVTDGSIAIDFTSGHPELIFEVSDADQSNIREVHHEPGTPAGTQLYAAPLPVTADTGIDLLNNPTATTETCTHQATDSTGTAAPAPPKKLLPFRWYGGKHSSIDFITQHLPHRETYIEPFAGSATVLLNRKPSNVEVLNDIDNELIRFFRVLREQPGKLVESLALTPFSRAELETAIETSASPTEQSDIELARAFMVKAGQTRTGLAQQATPGRWAYTTTTSRREMASSVSRWYGRLQHLPAVADRLRRVQLENRDAVTVIETYADADSVIYVDPPYPPSVRTDANAYAYEFDTEDHRELAQVLKQTEAAVAISGYECSLFEELYENAGWYKRTAEEKVLAAGDGKTERETLWMNYDPDELQETHQDQTSLSHF